MILIKDRHTVLAKLETIVLIEGKYDTYKGSTQWCNARCDWT